MQGGMNRASLSPDEIILGGKHLDALQPSAIVVADAWGGPGLDPLNR
jgi:hypothetical protein